MIEVTSINGYKKMVPKEKMTFRPGAYGVIINDGKVLLVSATSNNKYYFPGGGIELGEKIETALKREVLEETGLKVEVEKFIHFKEGFVYYDHWDKATHNFSFYYSCRPKSIDSLSQGEVNDEGTIHPQWLDVSTLDRNKCGKSVIETLEILGLL